MLSLVDTHCHLCAGLDDGPQSLEEAIDMCQMAYKDGTRWIAALAHQNPRHPEVTSEKIKQSIAELSRELRELKLPLTLRPTGEIMVQIDTLDHFDQGRLLTYGDQGKYLLLEYPTGLYFDIRHMLQAFQQRGIRAVLAHPERHPELLNDRGRIEQLIQLGALVQVSASSLTDAVQRDDLRAVKKWVERGVVHLVGSDGHSTERRTPLIGEAYRRIADWAGISVADRICGTNGLAVMQGLPLHVAPPEAPKKRFWFMRR